MKPTGKKPTAKTPTPIRLAAQPAKSHAGRPRRQPTAERETAQAWKQIASLTGNEVAISAKGGEALRRLGVSREALAEAPPITPILKLAQGGMKTVIDAMRLAPDPLISQFLQKYHAIPEDDRIRLPIEAVAIAAGVNVVALLGSIMLALQGQSVAMVKMLALTSHPQITAARIQYGMLPGGDRDRQALDTAMGFLPSPKGPTFIGKAVFGSGKSVMDQQRGPEDEDEETPFTAMDYDMDKIFPPPRNMQEKLALIRNGLPDPSKKNIN